jgi:hypothetical protein
MRYDMGKAYNAYLILLGMLKNSLVIGQIEFGDLSFKLDKEVNQKGLDSETIRNLKEPNSSAE